jgi:tRNA (mo5U34)-methyltransferase
LVLTEDRIKELENELDVYYNKFIIESYNEVCHRSPSENELRGWRTQLKGHISSPQHFRKKLLQIITEVKKDIPAPDVYTTDMDNFQKIVDQLYHELFQRPADKIGLDYYSKLLKENKLNKEGIKKELLNSAEYLELNRTDLLPNFKTSHSTSELKKMIDSVPEWYHTFKFDNLITPNARTDEIYQNWISQAIPLNLENKSILDVGKADGYYSFLCEHRGAKKIVATDFSLDLFPGFSTTQKILNSKVEYRNILVENLEKISAGESSLTYRENFDIVLFLGLYYHLSNPILALEKIFKFVTDHVIFSGPILNSDDPLMAYYGPFELHPNDDSNWWVASPSCIIQCAKRIGFTSATMISSKDIWGNEENNPFLSNDIKNSVRNVTKVGLFKFSK